MKDGLIGTGLGIGFEVCEWNLALPGLLCYPQEPRHFVLVGLNIPTVVVSIKLQD